MTQRGFTLIELMIVVAILGILASYAMPAYQNFAVRAQVTEGLTLVTSLQDTVTGYYNQNGRFPDNNTVVGWPAPDKILGNYVTGVTIAKGALHIEFGHYIHRAPEGKVLTLRPQVVDGSPASPLSWQCGYRTPPDGLTAVGENRTDLPPWFLPLHCI